jgi:surface carbohydrate biosynthesis protein (TIGR04326 family)
VKKLTLWCSPEHAPPSGNFTVYWSQYISEQEREQGNVSLPEMINEDASYWKPRYLSWLDGVGKSWCGSTTVVDALLIRPEFSYWWMTIPANHCFGTTSIAYATLRLWALAQIADARNVEELRVCGADASLEEVLTLWCHGTGRKITFIPAQVTNKSESRSQTLSLSIKNALPPLVKGLGYLFLQYLRYFTMQRPQRPLDSVKVPAITVVDYFASFDVAAAHESNYKSNYWGPLTPLLHELGLTINWIHLDIRSASLPDVRSARSAIAGLNRGSGSSQHVLIQDHLKLGVALKTMARYMRIRRIARQNSSQIHWDDSVSGIDVSPLITPTLHSDLRGLGAAKNALWLTLFEETLSSRTSPDACIYLMENKPWELAFLNAWTIRGSGPAIGVAHTTVRTWDLPYALGSSTVSAEDNRSLPRPALVAVIDPASEGVMSANGLKPSMIIKVEALRFLSLDPATGAASSNRSKKFARKRVLVFGEYDAFMCALQLQILQELVPLAKNSYAFRFRPHPADPILQRSLPAGVSLSRALSVREDLAECDVALCSDVSATSLDANLEGVPVLMFRDGRGLNGSLLSPGPSVRLVNNATDVLSALEQIDFGSGRISGDEPYPMYLDIGLTKWKALLTSTIGHGDA